MSKASKKVRKLKGPQRPALPTAARSDPPVWDAFAKRPWLGLLALSALATISLFPALLGGFVWDDIVFLHAAPIAESTGLWRIWFSPREIPDESYYRPLVYTTFWLEHRLWGFSPAPFHGTNLLLHCINLGLLWRLLTRLAVPGAWIAAALFAVHPVHVEAVAWVIGRKDLMAAAFYLSAALLYMGWMEAPPTKRRKGSYAWALTLFVAGLLCKSNAATLPAALLIWLWLKNGRIAASDWLCLAPFFAISLAAAVAQMAFFDKNYESGHGAIERLLVASQALWFYIGKLLWPSGLAVIYPRWEVNVANPVAWVCLIAALALPTALYLLRRRIGRGPLAGTLFFAVSLLPILGLFDHNYMAFSFVADRYQYLADIGPLAVLVGAAAHGLRNRREWMRGAALAAAFVVALLGALTYRQAGIYKDELTFFNHIVAHNPQAHSAHLNLSKALFHADRLEEALAAIRTAEAKHPESTDVHWDMGAILAALARHEEALQSFQQALKLAPGSPKILSAMGTVQEALGQLDEAARHHRQALAINPLHQPAMIGLFDLGYFDEVEQHVGKALAGHPEQPELLMDLALTRLQREDPEEALALFRQATQAAPDNAKAWSGTSLALFKLGRREEALQAIDRALSIDPDLKEARDNRRAMLRQGAEAAVRQTR